MSTIRPGLTEDQRGNSFSDEDLEGMSHGNNAVANAYRELLASRRLIESYRIEKYRLLEQRNREGLDVSNAILNGIVPDQHPMRSRLVLLANHYKREQAMAGLLREAKECVYLQLESPNSRLAGEDAKKLIDLQERIDDAMAGKIKARTITEKQEFELTTVLQSIASGFSDDPAHDAAALLKRITGEVPWTGDSFQLPPHQGGESCDSESLSSSTD